MACWSFAVGHTSMNPMVRKVSDGRYIRVQWQRFYFDTEIGILLEKPDGGKYTFRMQDPKLIADPTKALLHVLCKRNILFRKFTNITFEQQTGMRKYFDEHKIRTGRKRIGGKG